MSITVKLEPQLMQPVFNSMILVLDSTKKTQDGFLFRTTINSEGVQLSRLKHSQNLDKYGVIDLHKHLANEVSMHIPWTGNTTFQRAPHNYVIYDLDLAEIYQYHWPYTSVSGSTGNSGKAIFSSLTEDHKFILNDSVVVSSKTPFDRYNNVNTIVTKVVDTKRIQTAIDFSANTETDTGSIILSSFGTTVFTGTTELTPATKYAFNGVRDWVDVPNWSYTTYLLSGATIPFNKFLTSLSGSSNNLFVGPDDQLWFSLFNQHSDAGGSFVQQLRVISSSGDWFISNEFSGITDDTKFLTVGVGPYNINNTTSKKTIVSGVATIPAGGNYTIQTYQSSATTSSELFTFSGQNPCSKYETYRLIFQDRLGSLLCINFDRVSRKNISLEKTNYIKNFGEYKPGPNTWGYNRWDRGKKRLSTISRERITITSNWVKENVSDLIAEMVNSPEVYHLDENRNFRAIDILTTSYEKRKRVNDQIINWEINFEYSGQDPQQNG